MSLNVTEIKKIGIFRALQLGDMLCSVPAIRSIRRAFPGAEISLIGLPWAETFVTRYHMYIDRFIPFPGFPGLPEQKFEPLSFSKFLDSVLKDKFDLILQMQGDGTLVNPLVELMGGKSTAGFFKEGIYKPANGYFMEYPEKIHEINRHLKLVEFLGLTSTGTDLEFPLTNKDFDDFSAAELPIVPHTYICIHPGSRSLERRLQTKYFAQLADLAAENELTPVLTGTSEELDLVREVSAAMKYKAVIAAGKTSMGALAVLIKKSSGLISNCTGVAHLAAALKVRSVVISLNGEAFRWDPLNKDLHYSVDWTTNPDFNLVYDQVLKMIKKPKAQKEISI